MAVFGIVFPLLVAIGIVAGLYFRDRGRTPGVLA